MDILELIAMFGGFAGYVAFAYLADWMLDRLWFWHVDRCLEHFEAERGGAARLIETPPRRHAYRTGCDQAEWKGLRP